ncbi:MAG: ABC transporter permease [Bacteroidales bacterium]|nr:ABC transporter permease [Bacteroidales bacterium]
MKEIWNIAKKEFKETLRDKRTLLVMIVVPLLLFPVIFTIVSDIQRNSAEEAMQKELRVGVINKSQSGEILSHLRVKDNMRIISMEENAPYRQYIRADSLDATLVFPGDFISKIDGMGTAQIRMYYQSTNEGVEERISLLVEKYSERVRNNRLADLGISKEVIEPVQLEKVDIATLQEKIGKYAGGLIPYVFIIFCFIGAMYPAIDLFTGEKERGTIETILTTPVRRIHILTGKMFVVVATGIISALLAIAGLFVGLNFAEALPAQIMEVAGDILQIKFIMLLLTMLIPLTIFFAGILIPISIYAKSFKEAQSIITPINILVILPGVVGMMPGIELDIQTAFIPVINIALATKDIVAGTIDYGLLGAVYASLILFAVLSVAFSVRYFGGETNILRT